MPQWRSMRFCTVALIGLTLCGTLAITLHRVVWKAVPVHRTEGAETPSDGSGQDYLVFETSEIDLGPIQRAAECTFRFRNRSNVEATLESVTGSSSCGIATV